MKFNQIVVPHINVNDTEVTLIEIFFNDEDFIKKNQLTCLIESTKAAVEVSSDFEGYIFYMSKRNEILKIGQPIAYIFKTLQELQEFRINLEENIINNNKVISKKASVLMRKHNLTEDDFKDISVISYNSVLSLLKSKETPKLKSKILSKYKENDILLIGDFNSCLVATEIFRENNEFNPVNFISYEGKEIEGVYSANINDLKLLKDNGLKNIFICLSDYKKSEHLLDEATKLNFNFRSCISKNASISSSSNIGKCALIQGFTLIGPQVTIGDYCKILNNVSIAHHSKLEDYVTIADGSNIGGNVVIGKNVYMGIGVNVNRRVIIGAGSTIISGITVIDFVKKNSVITNNIMYKTSSQKIDE